MSAIATDGREAGVVAPAEDASGRRAAGPLIRRFRVFRFKEGDEAPHFDEFDVETGPRTTVVEALRNVRLRWDPSLTLRHSCLHASCGTCGMRVNGQEVLACVTTVADLPAGPVVVEPLANAIVVSDLVVEMDDFYRRTEPFRPPLIRTSEAPAARALTNGSDGYLRFEDCIECGLCLSACPTAGTDARYLGPAALAGAARLLAEPRGSNPSKVLDLVDGEHGCWRCHMSFECTEVCPSNSDPAGAIMRLRRALTGRALRSAVRAGRREAP